MKMAWRRPKMPTSEYQYVPYSTRGELELVSLDTKLINACDHGTMQVQCIHEQIGFQNVSTLQYTYDHQSPFSDTQETVTDTHNLTGFRESLSIKIHA